MGEILAGKWHNGYPDADGAIIAHVPKNLYSDTAMLDLSGNFVKIVAMLPLRTLFLSAIILILFRSTASADAGIPMICIVEPMLIFLLVPVIIIESGEMARIIKGIKFSKILRMASMSNLVSTLIGFPIMWALMFAIQMIITRDWGDFYSLSETKQTILEVTVLAPFVPPHEGEKGWLIWVAYLFLMIPFFFVSYWIEYAVTKLYMKSFNPEEEQKTIQAAVFKANIASYILLIASPFAIVLGDRLGVYLAK
jgi:hypothetical protein